MQTLTSLDIITRGLASFGATSVINDEVIADHIVYSRMAVTDQVEFSPEALYVVLAPSIRDWNFLQQRGNFLVIGGDAAQIVVSLGQHSNAVLISERQPVADILSLTDSSCTAAQTWRQYAPRLLSKVVLDSNLNDMAEVAAEMLGNPTAILVEDGPCIAHSGQVKTDDKLWDDLVYKGVPTTDSDELSRILTGPQSAVYASLTKPTIFNARPWKRRLMAGIWINGSCDHDLVVLENERPLQESDFVLAECLCEVLKVAVGRVSGEKDSLSALFSELLAGTSMTDEDLMRRSRRLGATLRGKSRLMMFSPRHHLEDPFLIALELLSKLRAHFPDDPAFVHEQRVYLVAPMDHHRTGSTDKVRSYYAESHAGEWHLSGSAPFESIAGMAKAGRQCQAALALGKALLGDRDTYRYEDIVVSDFYEHAARQLNADDYCLPQIRQMVEQDESEGTELALTLFLFLANYKSMPATSELLHVHRNTVAYRLERVAEQYGLDLADVRVLDHIRLSFSLLMAEGTWRPGLG